MRRVLSNPTLQWESGEGLKMIKSELSGVFLSGIVENPFVDITN